MIRRPCAANVQKATQFLTAIHRTLWGHSRPVVRSQAPSATLVPTDRHVSAAISTQSFYARRCARSWLSYAILRSRVA